jgi:hypothetical protein
MANEGVSHNQSPDSGPQTHVVHRFAFIAAVFFFGMAGAVYFWIGPLSDMLPTQYSSDLRLQERVQFRSSVDSAWQTNTMTVRRVDQTISRRGNVSMIQGDLHIYYESGGINFESAGLYGVDRRTRQNLPGYGDFSRSGQFLLPSHVQPSPFTIWDPMFIGPRQASFVESSVIDGLPVLVFQFTAAGLDETAGYANLADVPEKYLAHTDGKGKLWIEPVSGIVVDYEDSGVSYFVNPTNMERIADFNIWNMRYIPETKASQEIIARETRLRILILETWLPVILLAASLGCLAFAANIWLRSRNKNTPAAL